MPWGHLEHALMVIYLDPILDQGMSFVPCEIMVSIQMGHKLQCIFESTCINVEGGRNNCAKDMVASRISRIAAERILVDVDRGWLYSSNQGSTTGGGTCVFRISLLMKHGHYGSFFSRS